MDFPILKGDWLDLSDMPGIELTKEEFEKKLLEFLIQKYNLPGILEKVFITKDAFKFIKKNINAFKSKFPKIILSLLNKVPLVKGTMEIFILNWDIKAKFTYSLESNIKSTLYNILNWYDYLIDVSNIEIKEWNDEKITSKQKYLNDILDIYSDKAELELFLINYFKHKLWLFFSKFILEDSTYKLIKIKKTKFTKFLVLLETYYNFGNVPVDKDAKLILNYDKKDNFYLNLNYYPTYSFSFEDINTYDYKIYLNSIEVFENLFTKLLKELAKQPDEPISNVISKYKEELIPIDNQVNISILDFIVYMLYELWDFDNYHMLGYHMLGYHMLETFICRLSEEENICLNDLKPSNLSLEEFINSINEQFILFVRKYKKEKIDWNY